MKYNQYISEPLRSIGDMYDYCYKINSFISNHKTYAAYIEPDGYVYIEQIFHASLSFDKNRVEIMFKLTDNVLNDSALCIFPEDIGNEVHGFFIVYG